jgi:superfamily II DNA/RNA helicase
VIHFDPPADHKDYLHRSGRTARAGATGTVVSLVTGDQQRAVRRLQKDLDLRAPIEAPRLEALHRGGHRIGEATPAESGRRPSSTRPVTRAQSEPSDESAQSVYVANLPWGATTEDMEALFGRFGEVRQATIITDRRTGRSKGFGFVDMSRPAARTAIDALHGSKLGGRDLTVRPARPKPHRG